MEVLPPLRVIAYIHNDFPEKFGIPRQSGLVPDMVSTIVFEPPYRQPEALRGLEGYSHLWLLWLFSDTVREEWSPTVRPPRLGGNRRVGVFATRSPFRPNPLGLSSVRLEAVETTKTEGMVLKVSGADLKSGTPIIDIKPYIAYTDAHPEAVCGFADDVREYGLAVEFPPELLCRVPSQQRAALTAVLEQDPRPSYQQDPRRVYTMSFGKQQIRFRVENGTLTVVGVD